MNTFRNMQVEYGDFVLNWDIFMVYILDLMYENPAHVSGRIIFIMTKNIVDQSYWCVCSGIWYL